MIKKLTKCGTSYAIVIDRAVMDLLNITPDTPLNITTDGRALHVLPEGEEISREELQQAASRFKSRFGRMMKRLAE